MGLHKARNFCTTKEMVSKWKRPPIQWERTFASGRKHLPSDKGLITRIYRKLKKLNSFKMNETIKKWTAKLDRTFSKEEI
jgi:hypothetical protein